MVKINYVELKCCKIVIKQTILNDTVVEYWPRIRYNLCPACGKRVKTDLYGKIISDGDEHRLESDWPI